jgi:hypothetical protein
MARAKHLPLLLFSIIILGGISFSLSNHMPLAQQTATYVGPEACKTCHSTKYDAWKDTGHANMLLTAAEAQAKGFPLPEGLSWDDIIYTIGGTWKIRYINTSGYIITWHFKNGTKVPGGNQWNVETQRWADYHAGEVKSYTCGSCHTTGYSPEGHQDNLPGIKGTWQFRGITCESCHGPGSEHIASPSPTNIVINATAAQCGTCHVRGDPAKIPAKGGIIRHHEQYNEWLASPHADKVDCAVCHEPHEVPKVLKDCADCHTGKTEQYAQTKMYAAGVTCADCHMPEAVKTAEGNATIYYADIRTHLLDINTDPNAKLTYTGTDGKEYATGSIPLGWSCLAPGCHTDKDVTWAAKYYGIAHGAAGLEAERSTLQAQVTALQNQTSTLQTDIENLEERIDSLESTVATVPYMYGGIGLAIGFIIGAAILYVVVGRRKP